MKITICGSMRFWDVMQDEAIRLLQNNIVYMPVDVRKFCKMLSSDRQENNFWNAIESSHYANIHASDAIYVINNTYMGNEYIGEDTQREIDIAYRDKKLIFHYKKIEGVKYLYTVDGMNLVIPPDYYFNRTSIITSDMYNFNSNGIHQIPLDRSIMQKLDMKSYRDAIISNTKFKVLLHNDTLYMEFGAPKKDDSIERILTISQSNAIATILAFTDTTIFIKLKDCAKDFINDISGYAARPRIFTTATETPYRVANIITWDLVPRT